MLATTGFSFGITITVDNLNIRPDNQFAYQEIETSSGTVRAHPDYPVPTRTQYGNPINVRLRLENLDLDGIGGNDDYIDFTLCAAPASGKVIWTELGWGIGKSMSPGTSLTFSIIDVSLSTGTIGSVQFDGFTSAAIQGSDWENGTYDISLDINGQTISAIDSIGGGPSTETHRLANHAFLDQTLKCDNARIGPNGGMITAREFDLQFTYTKDSKPMVYGFINLFGIPFLMVRFKNKKSSK